MLNYKFVVRSANYSFDEITSSEVNLEQIQTCHFGLLLFKQEKPVPSIKIVIHHHNYRSMYVDQGKVGVDLILFYCSRRRRPHRCVTSITRLRDPFEFFLVWHVFCSQDHCLLISATILIFNWAKGQVLKYFWL